LFAPQSFIHVLLLYLRSSRFSVGGAFSRTPVMAAAGARTPLSSFIAGIDPRHVAENAPRCALAGLLMLVVVNVITSVLYYLPMVCMPILFEALCYK
jgi:MFS superfamily sulfate permease-like transporter